MLRFLCLLFGTLATALFVVPRLILMAQEAPHLFLGLVAVSVVFGLAVAALQRALKPNPWRHSRPSRHT